ncbi:MAG: arsenate reductase ArsC [Dehalococcoidia bacterium]|nr:arsenate reductase ArsC [Dehalococcoidia bacterium]
MSAPLVPEVLFVCVHGAGRARMAAALLAQAADGRVRVRGAGGEPAGVIAATMAEAMAEVGIDLAAFAQEPLGEGSLATADYVITMGCGDACPVFHGKKPHLDWAVDDPAGQDLATVRLIRDQLRERIAQLLWVLP